ncbi:hypothetical protein CFP56_009211 [Quercus suber]|uniref:DUF4283 domain-containing protein n=1 Tax=Quercus suber TaxID=58331 RepID=A0AAW0L1I7_QUESU
MARIVSFVSLPIWVQVWGLPFNLINEEVGWAIRKGLGHVVEFDSKAWLGYAMDVVYLVMKQMSASIETKTVVTIHMGNG